jgi:hypothetical protein
MKVVHSSKRSLARYFSDFDLPTASIQHDGDMLNKLSSPNALNDTKKDDDDKSEKLYSLKFNKELDKTAFTIFRPIADCGYYGWNPMKNMKLRPLSKVKSAKEILQQIDINQKPKEILPLSQLKLPCSFDASIPPAYCPNKYPFGQYGVASLYVASKYRNVDLNNVDFVFGGSILEMLARHDTNKPHMVCRIPTIKSNHTFLVQNCNQYTKNSADIGYQFERYITTGSMSYDDSNVIFDHMQVMDIGARFKVLICAEVDAIDHGTDPIEIKAKQKNWGTKLTFQMISSGSPTVCHGRKDKNDVITNIETQSLSEVAAVALRNISYQSLERNIVDGMQALFDQMKDVQDNESYEISFKSNGELSLQQVRTRNAIMLPPDKVVKELLDLK